MKWFLLFMGILANTSASLLIKYAVVPPRRLPSLNEPLVIFENWPLILGLLFYSLAFVLYAISLNRLPLNIAHPLLTAGSIALVAVFSALLLKEPVGFSLILGVVFILLGVFLFQDRFL